MNHEFPGSTNESMYERFRRVAQINADNWRDPEHDLEAIRLGSDEDRKAIEVFMLNRGIRHPMDVEALALLDTPAANAALIQAYRQDRPEIRAAVARIAKGLIDEAEQLAELIQRIAECDAYNGLDPTLTQIEQTHPPEVIEAMLKRIATDPGVAAVHFAAMVCFLFGAAKEPFDWELRPFFLRFNPGDEVDRREAFVELCQKIGSESVQYLNLLT
jgi:hypothetical protein